MPTIGAGNCIRGAGCGISAGKYSICGALFLVTPASVRAWTWVREQMPVFILSVERGELG